MIDLIQTTFTIKDNIATVSVVNIVQLDATNKFKTTNTHLVEIPEGVKPTREYILGYLYANK
jgi:hypothetical protein